MIDVSRVETPLGLVKLAFSDGRLRAVWFDDSPDGVTPKISKRLKGGRGNHPHENGELSGRVRRYFSGDLNAFDGVEIELEGTDFQKAVWREIRRIPPGKTRSYADIAKAVGSPRAVRAVGGATGANPVCLVIPCHRVVGSGGKLGGYGGGLDRKRWLLKHEGVTLARSGDT